MTRATDRLGGQPRGMAALTVVMGLFFVLALVAAYTNRNLVFEQRTAVNSLRAERAMNAADGAADWAVSMLNAGRLTNQCVASNNAADLDFRTRYLTLDPATGGYALKSQGSGNDAFFAGCIATGGEAPALRCACPTIDNKTVAVDAPNGYLATAFRVAFGMPTTTTTTPPGTVILQVRGCANSGSGTGACIGKAPVPTVDAVSLVRSTLGLMRALPCPVENADPLTGRCTPLRAAISAGNNASATASLNVTGGDWQAVGEIAAVTAGANLALASGGFYPRNRVDSSLGTLVAGGRFFENLFGMSADLYKRQPAAVRISCPAAGCKVQDLENAHWLDGYPGRTVVVDGDLILDTDLASASVGSAGSPAMLVVTGDLTWSKPMNFTGFLYARNISVNGNAATSSVIGAMVAAQDFNASVPMSATFDIEVINLIVKGYGSFIRVPGGWNRGA